MSGNRQTKNEIWAKEKRSKASFAPYGADNQIRTGDLILTKDALYRLSYISISCVCAPDARAIISDCPKECKPFSRDLVIFQQLDDQPHTGPAIQVGITAAGVFALL